MIPKTKPRMKTWRKLFVNGIETGQTRTTKEAAARCFRTVLNTEPFFSARGWPVSLKGLHSIIETTDNAFVVQTFNLKKARDGRRRKDL